MSTLVQRLDVDSAPLPQAERFAYWRQGMTGYDVAPVGDAPFGVKMDCWTLKDLVITDGTLTPVRFGRPPEKVRSDGIDHFSFLLVRSGTWTGEIDGRSVTGGPGQLIVLDLAHPFEIVLGADGLDSITVSVGRDALEAAAPLHTKVHGRVLDDAPGRMLADYFSSLTLRLSTLEQSHAAAVAKASIGVIAGCLATLPPSVDEPIEGPAVALRHRVRRHIDKNLADRGLTPARICRELAITRPTLYRTFQPLGGVASYIQRRRLEAVHARLAHPLDQRISDVAYSFGFVSEAHFSTAFRRRFGYSPRQARLGNAHARVETMSESSGPVLFREWIKAIR
jgi:AraC-like DNA-binding protein